MDQANLHSNMFLLIPKPGTLPDSNVKKFTFQYVSINTTSGLLGRSGGLYLHSNMFLLIPLLATCNPFTNTYLHSNMFLLILQEGGKKGSYQKFTFQYVSINTISPSIIFNFLSVFTFQYVSINTYGSHNSSHSNNIYIPICFY